VLGIVAPYHCTCSCCVYVCGSIDDRQHFTSSWLFERSQLCRLTRALFHLWWLHNSMLMLSTA